MNSREAVIDRSCCTVHQNYAPSAAVMEEGQGHHVKPRILIVDDEENIRKALHRWFEISGFDVDTAEDGVAAVELCAGTQYDVVTMDLEMPRMNGKEAIAAIKLLQPDVPILMLTGYPQNSAEVLNCGALKILTKPFRLQELEQEVRSVL